MNFAFAFPYRFSHPNFLWEVSFPPYLQKQEWDWEGVEKYVY